jgi:hypothetical protein
MGPGIIRLPRLMGRGPLLLRTLLLAVLAAAAWLPQQASAQVRTATANSTAILLTPGSIVKTADMKFGTIAVAGTIGTVVMSANALATCTTTGTLVHTGACQAAAFAIRGKKSQHVRIQDLANTGIVILTGPGGAQMTLDTMTISPSGMSANGQGNGWRFGNWRINDPSGNASFWMGGTLHVAATQAPGLYSGTLTIEIQFN